MLCFSQDQAMIIKLLCFRLDQPDIALDEDFDDSPFETVEDKENEQMEVDPINKVAQVGIAQIFLF